MIKRYMHEFLGKVPTLRIIKQIFLLKTRILRQPLSELHFKCPNNESETASINLGCGKGYYMNLPAGLLLY
jgi:hypothetical protein